MTTCTRCGQIADAKLCEHCSAETIRALTLLATLIADLRAMMTDLRATPSDNVRVDGTRETKLGADFDLSDRAHNLYATAANWATGWALALETPAPGYLAGYGHDNIVTGLPPHQAAFTAAADLASWLIGHHDEIAEHDDAGTYAEAIVDAIAREGRAIGYRPAPRKVAGRLCRTCSSATLRHSWPLGERPKLTCTACGEVTPCGPNLTRAVLQAR